MKFDYKDINLIPKLCQVSSRAECDTSVQFGNFKFKMPVVPANMECVIDKELAVTLAKNGYFYSMHRFDIVPVEFNDYMHSLGLYTSISVGIGEDSHQQIVELSKASKHPEFITIDIAHGHALTMKTTIEMITVLMPDTFIIAGNVSTPEAVTDLEMWGADAIKVGIGPGSVCTTYPATGFGSRNWQAECVLECAKVAIKPIIADGGISEPGEIAKALVMGATMVMVGGLMSGFTDSPGSIVSVDGKEYKEYWGSASQHQSGKTNRIEGKKTLIEYKNKTMLQEMQYLQECLQSAISYGGGKDLSCFDNVKYKI